MRDLCESYHHALFVFSIQDYKLTIQSNAHNYTSTYIYNIQDATEIIDIGMNKLPMQ